MYTIFNPYQKIMELQKMSQGDLHGTMIELWKNKDQKKALIQVAWNRKLVLVASPIYSVQEFIKRMKKLDEKQLQLHEYLSEYKYLKKALPNLMWKAEKKEVRARIQELEDKIMNHD